MKTKILAVRRAWPCNTLRFVISDASSSVHPLVAAYIAMHGNTVTRHRDNRFSHPFHSYQEIHTFTNGITYGIKTMRCHEIVEDASYVADKVFCHFKAPACPPIYRPAPIPVAVERA